MTLKLKTITKEFLEFMYRDLRKTDREIANFLGVDRTTIVYRRKKFGISSRKTTGEIGEELAITALQNAGFKVKNMNEDNKLSVFDLLVNDSIRVEVKSASFYRPDKKYHFHLSEQESNGVIESDFRFRLLDGRLRKDFCKTCDFMLFVCLKGGSSNFYIMPPEEIPKRTSGFWILETNNKFDKYKENWGLLSDAVKRIQK